MRWLILFAIGLSLFGCVQDDVKLEPTMRVVVGKTADFSETPSIIHPHNSEDFPKVWVIYTGKEYKVLLKETPAIDILHSCIFAWVDSNQRFEDPCTGAKFNPDGTYIEGPAYQNLDEYPVENINGRLHVDFGNIQKGEYVHPYYYSIVWTKSLIKEAGYESLEAYLEQAGYLPYTKDK